MPQTYDKQNAENRNWATDGCDFLGEKLEVGMQVAKPLQIGMRSIIDVRTVVRVSSEGIWLSGTKSRSTSKLMYSGRVVVIKRLNWFQRFMRDIYSPSIPITPLNWLY